MVRFAALHIPMSKKKCLSSLSHKTDTRKRTSCPCFLPVTTDGSFRSCNIDFTVHITPLTCNYTV